MPYKRRYRRKRMYRKKGGKAAKMASKALTIAKTLRRQVEYKFHANQPARTLTTWLDRDWETFVYRAL